MRYATPAAFRTALEARLLAHSKATSHTLDRLRKQVVFERLLARLLVAAPGRWVLKGGFALDLRLGTRARPTRDLDLARGDTVEQATADLLTAQALDIGDYFVFAVERSDDLDDVLEGAAVRYRVTASLAGRRFEQVVVDVGFGDPLPAEPDILPGSGLIAFAGVEPVRFPTLPLDQHIAEKVHAYTRAYGAAGHPSTRVKDIVDIVLVSEYAALGAVDLRRALRLTFQTRATHPQPPALPAPPSAWRVPYRRLAATVGSHTDLEAGHARAAALLDPVLGAGAADAAYWDPGRAEWRLPE
jgi:hypothetical protein